MIVIDRRDWYEQGLDPTTIVEELMRLWWELGLDKDIQLVASKRLYDRIKDSGYGSLTTREVIDETKKTQVQDA